MKHDTRASATVDAGGATSRKRLTVPSILSGFRLLASPVLVPLAWAELQYWCLGLFAVLLLSDWLDGKLAIALNQRTVFGARLDTAADVAFYACVLASVSLLKTEVVAAELAWIVAAITSYGLSVVASLIKFQRPPSYHTWLAKASWLLMTVALAALFADWSVWPLRVAMAGVVITNLEATLITVVLKQRQVNVPSILHALASQRPQTGVTP